MSLPCEPYPFWGFSAADLFKDEEAAPDPPDRAVPMPSDRNERPQPTEGPARTRCGRRRANSLALELGGRASEPDCYSGTAADGYRPANASQDLG